MRSAPNTKNSKKSRQVTLVTAVHHCRTDCIRLNVRSELSPVVKTSHHMKLLAIIAAPVLAVSLTQCVIDPAALQALENSSQGRPQGSRPYYGQPYTAQRGTGSVTIMEGPRRVSTIYTASPNVENTRFINEQQQIVVKSRGNHGPATVQLFDTRTGRQQGRVMAYEVRGGYPAWAAGMGE